MAWIFLVIGASILWAIGNIISKYVVINLNRETVIVFAFGGSIVGLLALVSEPLEFSSLALLAGILAVIGQLVYYRALSEYEVSKTIALLFMSPIFIAVIATFALGEILTFWQYGGILLSVLGAITISFKGIGLHRGALFALLASFIYALCDVLS